MSNSVGSVTSQAAGLDVTSSISTPPPVAPSISTQPAMAIVTVGGSATLAIAASGSGEVAIAATVQSETYSGSTPNGKIIFNRDDAVGNSGLYIANADGSGTQILATAGGFAGATPTGRVLYSGILNGVETLYGINADGSGLTIVDAPFASDSAIGVAADGRVVYQRRVTNSTAIDLYAINADGTGRVQLASAASFLGFAK